MPIKFFILLFLAPFLIINIITAQKDCYTDLRARGVQLLKAKDYRRSIDKFFAARYCPDKPAKEDLDELIKKAQDAWVAELDNARKDAELQKQRAEASLDRVNQALTNSYYNNKALSFNRINAYFLFYEKMRTAISIMEDEAMALEWRDLAANLLLELKAYDLAAQEYDSILTVKPDFLPARQNRSVAYYYLYQDEACLRDCDYLIEKGAFPFIVRLNKALVLARLRRYDEAIALMKEARRYFLQGDISDLYVDSNLAPEIEAVTGFNALFVDEGGMLSKIDLVMLAFRVYKGDVKALQEFNAAPEAVLSAYINVINYLLFQLKVQPQDYGARVLEALLWEKAGYPAQGYEALATFLQAHQAQKDARYQGFVSFAKEKLNQLSVYKAEKLPLPKTIEALGLSINAKELENYSSYDAALPLYEKASELSPNNLNYRLATIRIYKLRNDWEKVQKESAEVLKKWQNNAEALYQKAIADYYLGNNESQLKVALEHILQIDPFHVPALYTLADFSKAENPTYSIKLLEQILQMSPGNVQVRQELEELRSKN